MGVPEISGVLHLPDGDAAQRHRYPVRLLTTTEHSTYVVLRGLQRRWRQRKQAG